MQIIAPDLGIRNRPDVKLLLNGVGADQSTNIVDSSYGGPKTITRVGNPKIIKQDLRHPYAMSAAFFPGTASDYISAPDSVDWPVGSDLFTFEFWAYILTSPGTFVEFFSQATGSGSEISFGLNANKYFHLTTGANYTSGTVAWTWNTNQFYHIAAVRDGPNSFKIHINGALFDTTTLYSTSISDISAPFVIGTGGGSIGDKRYPFKGYIVDFHYTKSVRYSGNFTPPTTWISPDANTKLLIRGDNVAAPTTFTDQSSAARTITTAGRTKTVPLPPGSSTMSFDGGSDGLTTLDSSDWYFGAYLWSISFYVLITLSDVYRDIISQYASSTSFWAISHSSTYKIKMKYYGVFEVETTNACCTPGAPTHIRIERYGLGANQLAIYANGISQALTWATALTANASLPDIAAVLSVAQNTANFRTQGYLRGVKLEKGCSPFGRNFTPPNRLS